MIDKTIINSNETKSVFLIGDVLWEELSLASVRKRPIVFLCIGTDRSTGDSLGPLVGTKLAYLPCNNIFLYGNLQFPVHAKNLSSILIKIKNIHDNPFIIAIDACLGHTQNISNIIIESKPIFPGAAVHKNLPPIGDLSITGIVNISGTLEFMVLQSTRLFIVMHLADIISKGIYQCISKMHCDAIPSDASDSIFENLT